MRTCIHAVHMHVCAHIIHSTQTHIHTFLLHNPFTHTLTQTHTHIRSTQTHIHTYTPHKHTYTPHKHTYTPHKYAYTPSSCVQTRQLTRIQWHQIRRLMGRPRRCSSLFFQEERQLLEIKRAKVRAIQQQVHQGVVSVCVCGGGGLCIMGVVSGNIGGLVNA